MYHNDRLISSWHGRSNNFSSFDKLSPQSCVLYWERFSGCWKSLNYCLEKTLSCSSTLQLVRFGDPVYNYRVFPMIPSKRYLNIRNAVCLLLGFRLWHAFDWKTDCSYPILIRCVVRIEGYEARLKCFQALRPRTSETNISWLSVHFEFETQKFDAYAYRLTYSFLL